MRYPLPLEVSPLNPARGLGSAVSSLSAFRAFSAQERICWQYSMIRDLIIVCVHPSRGRKPHKLKGVGYFLRDGVYYHSEGVG